MFFVRNGGTGTLEQDASSVSAAATTDPSEQATDGSEVPSEPTKVTENDGDDSASASSSSSSSSSSGPCTPSSIGGNSRSVVGYSVVECDGKWALTGIKGSDAVGLFHWNGAQWEKVSASGEVNGFHCYDKERLRSAGVPPSIMARTVACDVDNPELSVQTSRGIQRNANPACDGRNILIVDSVIVYPGENARAKIGEALDRNPDASFMLPGHCPSLRARVDGADVYAIYVDYGADRSSLCSAASTRGGNPRTLNTSGDFTSPC